MPKDNDHINNEYISLENITGVVDAVYDQLSEDKRESLLRLLITQQATKRIKDQGKKGKRIEDSLEEFAKTIEKKLMNRLVWQEVKTRIIQ